jgi:hypothetical protein
MMEGSGISGENKYELIQRTMSGALLHVDMSILASNETLPRFDHSTTLSPKIGRFTPFSMQDIMTAMTRSLTHQLARYIH